MRAFNRIQVASRSTRLQKKLLISSERIDKYLLSFAGLKSQVDQMRGGLPSELWALVAQYLSTRDWAGCSGTCKATDAIQPLKISLQKSEWPALRWLIKHYHSAEMMSLDVQGSGWQSALEHADLGAGPVQLQRLSVNSGAQLLAESLSSFVSSQANLQVLHLISITLPNMSALGHLKHLVLGRTSLDSVALESLSALQSLETLSLFHITVSEPEQDVEHALDLRMCLKLHSVFLDSHFVPAILVAEDCAYNLVTKSDKLPSFCQDVICTSIHIMDSEKWVPLLFLQNFSRLRVLRIGGSCFAGNGPWPMGLAITAPMPCLEELALFGESVNVAITGMMQPRKFFLTGLIDFGVRINAMDSFVGRMEEVCLCGPGGVPVTSPTAEEMQRALEARGARCSMQPLAVTSDMLPCGPVLSSDEVAEIQEALKGLVAVGFGIDKSRAVPDVSWVCSCDQSVDCSRWQRAAGLPKIALRHGCLC